MRKNCNAYYYVISFIFIIHAQLFSQDQAMADSLKLIYERGNASGVERLELLRNLSFNETNDLDVSLRYAEELIREAKESSNDVYLYRGYSQKGQAHRLMGDLTLALDAFFKSVDAASKLSDNSFEGGAYLTIADVYSEIGNAGNAERYYTKSIQILRKNKDSLPLATALLNSGDEFFNSEKYPEALKNYEESGRIFEKLDYQIGTAYNYGNIGMVYAEQGKDLFALANINEAITMLEALEDYYAVSEYLTYMADIYIKRNEISTATEYAERSLLLATKYGLKKQISESNLKLAKIHEDLGNIDTSYNYFKDYITYRDSVINIETVARMADLRTENEVSQKQAEVDLLNQQKRNQLIIIGCTSFLLISLFWYYISIKKEKRRSEKLLLNILPKETAKELKQYGKVTAKKFESITVLFTDFKDFTQHAENLAPEVLVESVDFYFSKFDAIIASHGLEKIKTIGDAYMCAGGLHRHNTNQAKEMVHAAKEIIAFVEEAKGNNSENKIRFEIRIGIHTGPVVAGVVGTHKFAYDIWGDAVNVASRMESNSEPGKINISDSTYHFIKSHFEADYRGEIAVKNREAVKMYFINTN